MGQHGQPGAVCELLLPQEGAVGACSCVHTGLGHRSTYLDFAFCRDTPQVRFTRHVPLQTTKPQLSPFVDMHT